MHKSRLGLIILTIITKNCENRPNYLCEWSPVHRRRARGALGGGSPLSFSEKNGYSGKNIIFFGQINRLQQIYQSGKIVSHHGRKYHSMSIAKLFVNYLYADVSRPLHNINNKCNVAKHTLYLCEKTNIPPQSTSVIAAFKEYPG